MTAPKMFDLAGKVAIVTGGNGGIGRGIALGLAEAGASIAILARNEEKSHATLKEIEAHGVKAIALKLDVTRRDDLRPAFEEVGRQLGPVAILVNNAGVAVSKSVLKYSADDWDCVIETNLNSVFFLSQIAAQSMAQRSGGKIINIASEYSRLGSPSVVFGVERRPGAAHEVDGDRACAAEHPGKRDRTRMDHDRDDGAGAVGAVSRRDHHAHAGGALRRAGGTGGGRDFSRLARGGLRDRLGRVRRRGLRDPLTHFAAWCLNAAAQCHKMPQSWLDAEPLPTLRIIRRSNCRR